MIMPSGVTRRQFGVGVALATVGALARPALALGSPKVVVIGGGAGGATVAVELKRRLARADVTLVEPQVKYTSCFFSNSYIGGLTGWNDLTHSYKGLSALGIQVVHDRAVAIDTFKRIVALKSRKNLEYDRLVVAPGIDFKWDAIAGYSAEAAQTMPHAWRGGDQSILLRKRLEKMEDGGTVVITVPKLPYRCPPGPYERACVIANYLKQAKPRSKLVILDAKLTFSKQAAFEEAFAHYYKDIIELNLTNDIDDFSVERVDPADGEVRTLSGLSIKAAVANIIPPQTAGAIALQSGLADPDWCPINADNFTSAKAENVYVLGDAAIATDMPKSAFSAHSQGLVVAADIAADLDMQPRKTGSYMNTCWSIVAPDDAIKIGATYAPGTLAGDKPGLVPSGAFVSMPGESAEERKATFDEAFAWYPNLVSQIFNKSVPWPPSLKSGGLGP
jgi:NADPH-dependent 2,4-dienoyl-CoA reductase/sulfur reductase-like enzyme